MHLPDSPFPSTPSKALDGRFSLVYCYRNGHMVLCEQGVFCVCKRNDSSSGSTIVISSRVDLLERRKKRGLEMCCMFCLNVYHEWKPNYQRSKEHRSILDVKISTFGKSLVLTWSCIFCPLAMFPQKRRFSSLTRYAIAVLQPHVVK